MRRIPSGIVMAVVLSFAAGFFSRLLYERWNPPVPTSLSAALPAQEAQPGQAHPVRFTPLSRAQVAESEQPVLEARDVERIRALSGRRARIRGRVFRVGHSAKTNTYFVNFGPSRQALTAVIFSSAVNRFENGRLAPTEFTGRLVEITGEIKDHPQYGLEVILEDPSQIRIVN